MFPPYPRLCCSTSNVQLFQLFHLRHVFPGPSLSTFLRLTQKSASLKRAFLLKCFFIPFHPLSRLKNQAGQYLPISSILAVIRALSRRCDILMDKKEWTCAKRKKVQVIYLNLPELYSFRE